MKLYRNFGVASYMFAYYAADTTDRQIRDGIETCLRLPDVLSDVQSWFDAWKSGK